MTFYAALHSIAILKGAVEGDEAKHLGSTLALTQHAAKLLDAGLVTEDPEVGFIATDAGRTFYDAHRLRELPDGRANSWGANDPRTTQILRDAQKALRAVTP